MESSNWLPIGRVLFSVTIRKRGIYILVNLHQCSKKTFWQFDRLIWTVAWFSARSLWIQSCRACFEVSGKQLESNHIPTPLRWPAPMSITNSELERVAFWIPFRSVSSSMSTIAYYPIFGTIAELPAEVGLTIS